MLTPFALSLGLVDGHKLNQACNFLPKIPNVFEHWAALAELSSKMPIMIIDGWNPDKASGTKTRKMSPQGHLPAPRRMDPRWPAN